MPELPPPTRPCQACGTELAGTVRFCHRCGAFQQGRPPGTERLAWAAAVGVSLLFAAFIAWKAYRFESAPPPAMANAGNAGPGGRATAGGAAAVDLSSMTPRERFDRLFDRVMAASERGDAEEAGRFLPMALMAYGQLDSVDQDARFHAALLQARGGDWAAVRALTDTMLVETPGHLLALLVQEAAAEVAGDSAAARIVRSRFLQAWDAQIASARPEYADHRAALDDFHARAQRAGP